MEILRLIVVILINGIDAYVENGRLVKVEGRRNWLNKGELCEKGKHLVELIYSQAQSTCERVNGRFQRFPGTRLLTK